jgi:hypothetical protein
VTGPAPEGMAGKTAGDGRASRRSLRAALIAVIVLVLAGGGTAAALVLSGGHGRVGAASPPRHPASHSASPTPTPSSPPPTVSASPGSGQVGVAPSVAGDPQTPQVVALLDSYFGAINAHDYQAYITVLTPQQQQGLTSAQFSQGYASTKDSGETLQDISMAPDGSTVATVTFTSHQNPADSVNGTESCTTWQLMLYLQQTGNGYLIGEQPSSYHAKYAAC